MTSTPDTHAAPSSISPWPALHPTAQAAYNQILWNRGLAKADIARRLGVSRTRMTAVGRELEVAGLVVTAGRETSSTRGRPGDTLVAAPNSYHFLGIHVRGRQLVAAVIDLENRVVWEAEATVPELGAKVLFEHCSRWLSDARSAGFRVAAIAFCGSFQQLDDTPLGVDLRKVIGEDDRARFSKQMGGPVWVEDEMVALTAFEQWPRLGEGQDSMALIAVGPQIGFGIVTDRRIVVGAHRMAGRFAHVPVAPDGPPCPLGHRGCLWSVSSVSSILAQASDAATLAEVVERAESEPSIGLILAAAARGLGAVVGHIANLIDPDKVVLAGEARYLLQGRDEDFRAGLSAVSLGAEPLVETTDFGFVEWANAAAALALYRTLGGDRT
ncbi:ROK family protein [Lacisediminihabitans profunda]|uniref:ROK family protein n=1 Tax=Lacisediminihabitans profunda TaxID=2594790 RepID=A0A5C8UVY4_9MICO|nr:ROK family protein [Lacisediminihabitans profunda]TXN32500.1 ROK family protein [Lacisediminihabitans profunda]